MLTGIILKDYTTFIKETIFDFKATSYKILENTNVGSNRVLKGCLFKGENASGKTQVLEAILILLDLLFDNSEHNFVIKKSFYTKGTKYNLSYLFNVNNNDIKYDITFAGNNIFSEKLYVNDNLKLNRLGNKGELYFDEEKSIDDINVDLSLLKFEYYNTRFNNDEVLNEWFEFLKNSIYVNCLTAKIISYNPSREAEQLIRKYAERRDATKLNEFMNKLGYNSEIVFQKEIGNKDRTIVAKNDNDLMIALKKKGTDIAIPMMLESNGNRAFLNIILPILFASNNNCMLIVDEFSSGLHNELEEALISFFFNNSKDSQIFFTSHSTNLLNTSILRPDQIYSFKFDAKDGTIINRFSNENPRESQNMEKMYLNGVFDGMPKYNKNFKIN